MNRKTAMQTIAAMLLAVTAHADVIVAFWNFGPNAAGYTEDALINNTLGTPLLTVDGSGYQSSGQAGTAFTDAEGTTHSAGQAMAWSNLTTEDQSWTLRLDLTGYSGAAIRWDYRTTSTGPESAAFLYQIGQGGWISVQTLSFTRDSNWHEVVLDLSSISALNGKEEVYLRLTDFSGATSTAATYRTDNLQVTAIPEPATALMLALGLLTALLFRRRG